MRILAHIHTFNDVDIIDRTIESVRRQTRPVDGILVVDNASSDGTLESPSLRYATDVIRHPNNQGTSGAVHTGLKFGLEHGYDWVWVFDADSTPEPDALEKLLDLYASFPEDQQAETAFLACLHFNVEDDIPRHGGIFFPEGFANASPSPDEPYYACHAVIWSGCLYRLEAVRRIGLPNRDYVLDWGEGEYGYRVMRAGYKGFVRQDAILHHNIRGKTSIREIEVKLGPIRIHFTEFPPIRCYYLCRNTIYFALYEARERRFGLLRCYGRQILNMTAKFLVRPWSHGRHFRACSRGLWHGLTGNIAARY